MFNAKMQPYVSIKQTRSAAMADLLPCDSAAIRTQDLLLRRQLLYPAELRNRLYVDMLYVDMLYECRMTYQLING